MWPDTHTPGISVSKVTKAGGLALAAAAQHHSVSTALLSQFVWEIVWWGVFPTGDLRNKAQKTILCVTGFVIWIPKADQIGPWHGHLRCLKI